jgi:uncharacterized protein (TIGR03437 family)
MSYARCCFSIFAVCGALAAQTVSYSYDAAGRLNSVSYPNGKVQSYLYDPAGNLLRTLVRSAVPGPAPVATAAGVVNAASFQGGAVSPGEIVAIFGTGIGPDALANGSVTGFGYYDSFAGDTSVLFDGVPAPIIFASSGLTSVIVPYSVAGQSSTLMSIVYQGRASAPATLPVAAAAPGLFSANASGSGNGAIYNQDNTRNGPSNPAAKGSLIVLYGTGEGQTNPSGVTGRLANSVYPKPALPVKVTIGGVDAAAGIAYAGAVPTLVAGIFQINVTVPAGVASGSQPVVVQVGSFSSQANLTVSVQ